MWERPGSKWQPGLAQHLLDQCPKPVWQMSLIFLGNLNRLLEDAELRFSLKVLWKISHTHERRQSSIKEPHVLVTQLQK